MANIFFYQNCILCGTKSSRDFCSDCFENLPGIAANHCTVCLQAISSDQIQQSVSQKCGSCLSKPPAYDATEAALTYTFPVDALIHALKYQTQLAIAPILSKLFLSKLKSTNAMEQPDLLIPMPLHPKRLQERGFNQALEIARHIAPAIDVKLITNGCQRIRNTPPQTELPWKSRQQNVRKAFNCRLDFSGKHVAVIDDVMTTGATLNELAQQLRRQGAVRVTNWVIARVQTNKPYWDATIQF